MKGNAHKGWLRFAMITFALTLTSASSVFADESTSPSAPSDKAIQERAVPMQNLRYLQAVPRLNGPRSPIPPRGGTMAFSCGQTSCTCHGDVDCNNMFSTNVCGGAAVCDTTGVVECSCLRQ